MKFKQAPNNHPEEAPELEHFGGTWKNNPNGCWCMECNPNASWFIVCDECGNKRCNKAKNHRHKCTNSNSLNQPEPEI